MRIFYRKSAPLFPLPGLLFPPEIDMMHREYFLIQEGYHFMEPKLTLRIVNSDLLPVQGRYEELLNAPDMGGALTAWRGDTAIALLVLLSGNERVEGATACAQPFETGRIEFRLRRFPAPFSRRRRRLSAMAKRITARGKASRTCYMARGLSAWSQAGCRGFLYP